MNQFFLKSFRILLFPFSCLYAVIIVIRNFLYNKGIFHAATFNLPIICVGNLAVGGTGKSPMVEYLISLLHNNYAVATLSRGYKRKTKGYILANNNTTAIEIGDEPMQFHLKFPDVAVAVGEHRIIAIPQLLQDKPNTEVIVLDDAYQHRAINAGLNILLTEFSNLYCHDFYLPTGDLRDVKSSADRAQIIIVTKCPENLSESERRKITEQLLVKPHQKIFFTTIGYGTAYHITNNGQRQISSNDEVLLVCGIANPEPLKQYLHQNTHTYYFQSFPDHHIFSIDDLKEIEKRFSKIDHPSKYILTTEKDAVRLLKFRDVLENLPIYVLPIKPQFLFNEQATFDAAIISFIHNYNTNNGEKE